jgi:hypothetical protein
MTTTPLEAIARLEQALDELARALVDFSSEAVLRAEESLGAALTALSHVRRSAVSAVEDKAALAAAVGRTRQALIRCQALGRSGIGIANGILQQPAYGRDGVQLNVAPSASRRATVR